MSAAGLDDSTYAELQRLAHYFLAGERGDHTLRPTELVHEAWLRLARRQDLGADQRASFLRAAGTAMRRILVDHARSRLALRRSRQRARSLDDVGEGDLAAACARDTGLTGLDLALDALETVDAELARLVELRFFCGLTVAETASTLGLSQRTVQRNWRLARAWLHGHMDRQARESR